MKKFKLKNLLTIVLALVLLAVTPLCVLASDAQTGTETYSLTVEYNNGKIPLKGAKFKIYRALTEAFELIGDFASYPIEKGEPGSETLAALAPTLSAYVSADKIAADYETVTDTDGKAYFGNLPGGFYLVIGEPVTIDEVVYTAKPFLVCVPYFTEEKVKVTDVVTTVKYDYHDVIREPLERSVVKVWDDSGNAARPAQVTVQLLKDGTVFDEVKLDAQSGWKHTWTGLDPDSEWKLVEAVVPEGYKVEIAQEGTIFIVTNHLDETTVTPGTPGGSPNLPQTGQLWWPVPLMLILGIAMLLSGIVSANINRYEKA